MTDMAWAFIIAYDFAVLKSVIAYRELGRSFLTVWRALFYFTTTAFIFLAVLC